VFSITLDKTAATPLFEQLVKAIKAKINQSVLRNGDKLPPTRILAEQLAISRTTVCKAYDELYALGYLESYQGGYSKVRQPKTNLELKIHPEPPMDWQRHITSRAKVIQASIDEIYDENKKAEINFSAMAPDPGLMPVEDFRKCCNQVLKEQGASLLQYGTTLGHLPLREYIADHLRQYGILADSDEILLTTGSQQALDLICQMMLTPNDSVLVESPTYSLLPPLLTGYKANIASVPMTASGLSISALKNRLDSGRFKFLYTIPNFHNPTGISSSQQQRERLLTLCQQYQLPIIEDGFVDEMKYFGKTPLPIKAMDKQDMVLYLGSFSKILFPGVRIGWVVANKACIDTMSRLKLLANLRGNQLNQAALNQFCRQGLYDKHIKRAHSLYRRRMKLALKLAKQHIPADKFSYTVPNGGYTLLVSAKDGAISEEQLVAKLHLAGVSVSPGRHYFVEPQRYAHFRMSVAELSEEQISQGFARIGQVIRSLIEK